MSLALNLKTFQLQTCRPKEKEKKKKESTHHHLLVIVILSQLSGKNSINTAYIRQQELSN